MKVKDAVIVVFPPETWPTSFVPTIEDVAIWKRIHRDITQAQGMKLPFLCNCWRLRLHLQNWGGNYRQSQSDENIIHFVLYFIISTPDSLSNALMNCSSRKGAVKNLGNDSFNFSICQGSIKKSKKSFMH